MTLPPVRCLGLPACCFVKACDAVRTLWSDADSGGNRGGYAFCRLLHVVITSVLCNCLPGVRHSSICGCDERAVGAGRTSRIPSQPSTQSSPSLSFSARAAKPFSSTRRSDYRHRRAKIVEWTPWGAIRHVLIGQQLQAHCVKPRRENPLSSSMHSALCMHQDIANKNFVRPCRAAAKLDFNRK